MNLPPRLSFFGPKMEKQMFSNNKKRAINSWKTGGGDQVRKDGAVKFADEDLCLPVKIILVHFPSKYITIVNFILPLISNT